MIFGYVVFEDCLLQGEKMWAITTEPPDSRTVLVPFQNRGNDAWSDNNSDAWSMAIFPCTARFKVLETMSINNFASKAARKPVVAINWNL